MLRWLKRIAITFFITLALLAAFLRFQGGQYLAAYSGAGFAKSLPNPNLINQSPNCESGAISVLSYNVMYGSAFIEAMAARFKGGKTGANELPWSVRLPEIRARIASYAPDLMGLQEMGEDADIAAIVPLTEYALVTYHLGGLQYGDAALLYKTARFEQLDSGQLWLGNNPELPLSLGFKKLAMIRYVNWALLRDKTNGFTFLFVNTHFDNARVNKEPSATLFRERVASLARQMPVIVTGDFNTTAKDERYRRFTGSDLQPPLLENGYALAHAPMVDTALHPEQRIDHILAGSPCKMEAENWSIDPRPLANGQPMSDHDPVLATLKFFNPSLTNN